MKNTFKKMVASIIAITSLTMSATGLHSMAETNDVESEDLGFGEGLIPESEDELNAFAAQFDPDNQIELFASTALPSSVDLSDSPCFPPIGDQGSIGSCIAWASTYYQYSYEVNKLNNVTSTADRVIYSPKWTYNNINSGVDNGSSFTNAYTLLKNQGAVTLNEFPYYSSAGYDLQDLPTYNGAIEDMRNALYTRLSFYGTYTISGNGTVITSNKDSDLNQVKTALNNGKVLTFQTYNDFNYKKGTGNWSNTKLVYRCYDAPDSGSHAMTIVGYDDNVTCDINGNGTIEAGERGAFKVINSWGVTNSKANNAGVLWVMYDALNGKSANNLNESQFSSTRKRVFGIGTNNVFNYINVEHKTVAFVAEVSFSTDRRNQVQIKLSKKTSFESDDTWATVYGFNSSINNPVSYDGTMVFDYGDLTESLIDFYENFDLRISLNDTYSDGNKIEYKNMKITDSLGNVVSDYGKLNLNLDGSSYAPISRIRLSKGDVDLNKNITVDDAIILQDYLLGKQAISYLQYFLSDMNDDRSVDVFDLSLLKKQLTS